MRSHKSLLPKPHVALGTHFINLKSHKARPYHFNQHLCLQKCKYTRFGRFLAPSGLFFLGKGYARAQAIACAAAEGTRDKLDQSET